MSNRIISSSDKCWACKEKLQLEQKFCSNCKHWQDWRKHTSFSATILALLVAFISVFSATIPNIVWILTPEKVLLDMGGKFSKNCARLSDCIYAGEASALRLSFQNRGNVDILFSKTLECNHAASGHFVEQDDEYVSHRFVSHGVTGVNIGDTETFEYVYQTYQEGFTKAVISGLNLCVIGIDGYDKQYFTFYLDMDLDVFGGRVVSIQKKGLSDAALFQAIKGVL